MRNVAVLSVVLAVCVGLECVGSDISVPVEPGFSPLCNGRDLEGWTLVAPDGPGWWVADGVLVCPVDEGGNLVTQAEFEDFILRFEFRLSEGANNGVGIRAPIEGNTAYMGMEIQVLDDHAKVYSNLRPTQYHGSIIDVAPARRGALKRAGHWNSEEIRCVGRQIQVRVNDQMILDVDLNSLTDPVLLQRHPGMLRGRGHIGLIGEHTRVEFRRLRIKVLPSLRPDNVPPSGFNALFDGHDLAGWKGLPSTPERALMLEDGLAKGQQAADNLMRRHWRVEDGALVYRGTGTDNLVTMGEFGNFELLVDWKLSADGDSGIFLRGAPQIQITDGPAGSGGLRSNRRNPSQPMKLADRPVGEWNQFRILMTGEKVTVFLNNELVVHNVTFENFWERHRPIRPIGPIELQANRGLVAFKNIFIRELPR